MNKEEAIAKLEESFAMPSSTPGGGEGESREQFLTKERKTLLSLVIEPKPVNAKAGEWVRKYGTFQNEQYKMIAIAGFGKHWLLFNPENNEFALAEGELDGELNLVGFSSNDALAEWRG